jgi:hypothetical protein
VRVGYNRRDDSAGCPSWNTDECRAGSDRSDAEEACAQAGVAEGEGSDGRDVPCAEEDGAGAEAAYGVRERAVPEYRRVLEPEGRDLHDAGEPLHAAMRILRGA